MSSYLGVNWVDYIFLGIVVYYLFTNGGFIATLLEIAGFLFSLIFSYKTYGIIGSLIEIYLKVPRGISQALGFFLGWFAAESLFHLITSYFFYPLIKGFRQSFVDKILGYFAAVVQASLIFLFFVTLIFSFPVRGDIKKDILNSKTGPYFVNASQNFELQVKSIFSGAISESVNFLTIKPDSNETVDLHFKVSAGELSVDEDSENKMLDLLNNERVKQGIHRLNKSEDLTGLARDYGKVMFENGFFSHTSSVDGSDPGQRADKVGIKYEVLGENLAFASDVYLAHQGLMNSEGHRRNILSQDYNKVGIGVVDGGIYGKMFVQEFSN